MKKECLCFFEMKSERFLSISLALALVNLEENTEFAFVFVFGTKTGAERSIVALLLLLVLLLVFVVFNVAGCLGCGTPCSSNDGEIYIFCKILKHVLGVVLFTDQLWPLRRVHVS